MGTSDRPPIPGGTSDQPTISGRNDAGELPSVGSSSSTRYDGSRPPEKPTGISGRVIPDYILGLLDRANQKEHLLHRDIQQHIKEHTLRDGDISARVLANELLGLRGTLKDADRNKIVENLVTIGRENHDNLPKEGLQLENIMQMFEKYEKEAKNRFIVKNLEFESASEARDRALEGMIIITKALKRKNSAENLLSWIDYGYRSYIRNTGGREAWQAQRAAQMAAYWPGPISQRQNYINSVEVRQQLDQAWEGRQNRNWKEKVVYDRLHDYIEFGYWFYNMMEVWREGEIDNLGEAQRKIEKNEQSKVEGNSKKDSGINRDASYSPEVSEAAPNKTTEYAMLSVYNPEIVESMPEMDARRMVYTVQEGHSLRYESRIKRDFEENPDTARQNAEKLLQLHCEHREKIVSTIKGMRSEQEISKKGIKYDRDIEVEAQSKINEMIGEYMKSNKLTYW